MTPLVERFSIVPTATQTCMGGLPAIAAANIAVILRASSLASQLLQVRGKPRIHAQHKTL
jgi:hypothetical protein